MKGADRSMIRRREIQRKPDAAEGSSDEKRGRSPSYQDGLHALADRQGVPICGQVPIHACGVKINPMKESTVTITPCRKNLLRWRLVSA